MRVLAQAVEVFNAGPTASIVSTENKTIWETIRE